MFTVIYTSLSRKQIPKEIPIVRQRRSVVNTEEKKNFPRDKLSVGLATMNTKRIVRNSCPNRPSLCKHRGLSYGLHGMANIQKKGKRESSSWLKIFSVNLWARNVWPETAKLSAREREKEKQFPGLRLLLNTSPSRTQHVEPSAACVRFHLASYSFVFINREIIAWCRPTCERTPTSRRTSQEKGKCQFIRLYEAGYCFATGWDHTFSWWRICSAPQVAACGICKYIWYVLQHFHQANTSESSRLFCIEKFVMPRNQSKRQAFWGWL